jgi:hypothetical protein
MVELHFHSPVYLYGMMFRQLSTGTTILLPLAYLQLEAIQIQIREKIQLHAHLLISTSPRAICEVTYYCSSLNLLI